MKDSSQFSFYLSDRVDSVRSSNLNFIKFVAAILVIYSHSFYICLGQGHSDLVSSLTNGYISFGAISVSLFLFVSGLLVTKSLLKSKSAKQYFVGRIVRIFPLLIIVVMATAFILGLFVTDLPTLEYLSNLKTYRYLSYILLIPSYFLPGVFTSNPTNVVNGPLWTIVLEMICYVLLFIMFKLNFLKKKNTFLIILGCITGSLFLILLNLFKVNFYSDYLRPIILFFEGTLCYIYRDKIKLNSYLFVFMFLLGVISISLIVLPDIALLICLPYIVLYLSYIQKQCIKILSVLGEYSYGIYLVAYPIQQTLRVYNPNINPIQNTLSTALISLVIAYFLNKYIEKPCIKWSKERLEEK